MTIGVTFWERIAALQTGYLTGIPLSSLILKLSEETGKVSEAYIGMRGDNPRKGVCHSASDVMDELADVIITAAVAMNALKGSGVSAMALQGKLSKAETVARKVREQCTMT